MKVKEIAFAGIPVTDMKKPRAFYEDVLGLTSDPKLTREMWTEYPIGSGTVVLGGVGDQWLPTKQGTSAALEVENLEDAIARSNQREADITRWSHPFVGWPLFKIPMAIS